MYVHVTVLNDTLSGTVIGHGYILRVWTNLSYNVFLSEQTMPHYKFHLLLLKYCRQAVKYTALCILCLIVLPWSALHFASQMLQTALSVSTFVTTLGTAFVLQPVCLLLSNTRSHGLIFIPFLSSMCSATEM